MLETRLKNAGQQALKKLRLERRGTSSYPNIVVNLDNFKSAMTDNI